MFETILAPSIITEPNIITFIYQDETRSSACNIYNKADAIASHAMLHEDNWFLNLFCFIILIPQNPH
jgi:hypothetical protein